MEVTLEARPILFQNHGGGGRGAGGRRQRAHPDGLVLFVPLKLLDDDPCVS